MLSINIAAHALRTIALFFVFSFPTAARSEPTYDLVVLKGRVIDPASGFDGIRSLGITAGTITTIDEKPLQGRVVIDATGKIVTAGFIDLHSHAQTQLGQKYQVLDGVTTALDLEAGAYPAAAVGNNIADRPLINFGASASYAAMRSKVLTNSDNPYIFFGDRRLSVKDPGFTESLDSDQIERVMRHVRLGLDQGDIVIFDANTIADQATYTKPYQAPEGISWVVINGKVIVQDGAIVDTAFPGRLIMGGG